MIFKKEEESLTTCAHDKVYAKRKQSTENSNLERTAVYAGKQYLTRLLRELKSEGPPRLSPAEAAC